MTHDSKQKRLFKPRSPFRNGQLKKVRFDHFSFHAPLRRLNGFRISPTSTDSEDSLPSDLDSSIDYCVLPSKDSQNCENKLVKNDVNGNVIPIVETPSASTSHSVHESDNRNYDKTDSTSRHDKDLWRHDPWIRRKFYIVENGGRPSEVFCTDFLHNAKNPQRNINQGTDGDKSLFRVLDRWREEWNNGVQVPLSVTPPTYQFQQISLFPDMKIPEFHLPKKLVAFNRKIYTEKHSSHFSTLVRPALHYYTIDEQDEEWLRNQQHHKIQSNTFLKVINHLEVTTYKNIHTQLLIPLVDSCKDSEEDAICEICRLPEWEQDDQIVFCDGCNISVHQSCYGIDAIPSGEWMCNACELGKNKSMNCIFCPIKGGAMKQAKHHDSWAHVACALWIPEVRFGDVDRMEPITHINEIPAERWQNKCTICDTRQGACIKCTEPKCEEMFHVSCALRGNVVLKILTDIREVNGVKMVVLCRKHSASSHYKDKKKSNKQINRLSELSKNFAKYVDLDQVSTDLKIDSGIVATVSEYWRAKRIKNGCNPLINEPTDIMLQNATDESDHSQDKERKKPKCRRQPVASIYDVIPYPQLKREFEGVRSLRLNLEKARNLCYMITKREKLKLNQQELYRQNIMSSLNRLTDQSLPMSVRRMDKLLSLCRLATNDHQVEEKDVKIKVEPSDIEHTIQPCSPSFDKNKIKLGPESDSDVDAKYIIKTVNTRSRSRKQ